MKALCEPSRCRIVELLAKKAYCVSALAILLELSAAAVSQHLKVLREAGIVTCEKYGYHTHYKLNKERLAQIAADLLELTKEKPEHCRQGSATCDAADAVGCRTQRKD